MATPLPEWRIPLSDLAYGPAEDAGVARVLASRWLSTGPEVAAFEAEFAQMNGTQFALAVSSATAALHLALLSLGVGPGDEVIQPALNFVAAANTTRLCGATPVFADIASVAEPTVTADTVGPLLTARTKAVIVMHYGGTPADMDPLLDLCHSAGVALIEDACHAIGAPYGSASVAQPDGVAGSLGDLGCFSFFSNKNLATGEGGMVITDRRELAERCRLLRSHGMTTMSWDRAQGHAASYDVVASGLNYRMDDLHAALGRAQLAALGENNQIRGALLDRYRSSLAALPGWDVPFARADRPTAAHLAVALAPSALVRAQARDALAAAGIQTSMHYPLVTSFSAFSDVALSLPRSEDFAARALTLPLYPALTPAKQDEVLEALCRVG